MNHIDERACAIRVSMLERFSDHAYVFEGGSGAENMWRTELQRIFRTSIAHKGRPKPNTVPLTTDFHAVVMLIFES